MSGPKGALRLSIPQRGSEEPLFHSKENGPARFGRPFRSNSHAYRAWESPADRTTPAEVYGVVDDDEKVKHSFTVNVLSVTVMNEVPVSPSSPVKLPLTLLVFWMPLQVMLQSAFVTQLPVLPAVHVVPLHTPAVVTIVPNV